MTFSEYLLTVLYRSLRGTDPRVMEEERSKEEEDRAWWSDYQASTKLQRKWVKKEIEDSDEDLDDILGDLDDIVKKTDEKSTADHILQSEGIADFRS